MMTIKKFCLLAVVYCLSSVVCFSAEPKMTARDHYERAAAGVRQIEAWKAAKDWEGVYDKGPELKKRVAEDLAKAASAVKSDAVLLYEIKFLTWKNLLDDDPAAAFDLFDGVVAAANDAAATKEGVAAVKASADSVKGLEDKNASRRLYEVYAGSVINAGLSPDELAANADAFLDEGNNYLAKTLYEAFLETLAEDKASMAKKMVLIAGKFAHAGGKEALDPVYAENLYQKAASLAGEAAFDEASQYLRAFNLERIKDHDAAIAQYEKYRALFSAASRAPEVDFRLGVIEAYARKDRAAAQMYFKKIVDAFPENPLVLSSFYQMGVLAQWNKEMEAAKAFYEALLADAAARGLDTQKAELAVLARARLQEIADGLDMRYGLRLFMEGTFGQPAEAMAPLHVDLTAIPAKGAAGAAVKFVATTSNPQTGCMTPTYAYEWSGEVGGIDNIPNSPELTTAYEEKSLHVVGVAVVGPNGPEGVGFDIVQVE